MPSEYTGPSSNESPIGGVMVWNIGGRNLPSITEPQPTLKNPGRYWIQDEGRNWHEVDPLDYGGPDEGLRLSDLNKPDTRDEIYDEKGVRKGPDIMDTPWMRDPDNRRQFLEQVVPRLSEVLHGRRMAPPPQ